VLLLFFSGCVLFRVDGDGYSEDVEQSEYSDGLHRSIARIFVTEFAYSGDFSGLTGADSACNTEAQAAGLTRTYFALVVTPALSLSARFPKQWSRPVYTFDASPGEFKKVKNTLQEMTTIFGPGALNNPFSFTANGSNATVTYAWVGFNNGGVSDGSGQCGAWASTAGSTRTGYVGHNGATWAHGGLTQGCNDTTQIGLYCISEIG
jgi:hypothetical protein